MGPKADAPLASLRRFVKAREPAERCELCSEGLPPHPHHEHLLEPNQRQLLCSCTPCALLFPAEAQRRFRRVPRRLLHLTDFEMTDAMWDSLAIPVNMAFLHTSIPSGDLHAYYPSPAGATASLLTLQGWTGLVETNPVLVTLEPDVEALLIHRVGDARDHFIAPIDRCYELVGLLRVHWRGLSGGTDVWQRVAEFFDSLREQARVHGRTGEVTAHA
ncbi:MAG TPA: DUF5947 family protein [Candidatus Dormibacteraeota bacterium]|jgi:hypothetical protein|nr:DUF5947 family protein [Candidatus Dormibacteraeota bacterium]